MLSCARSYGGLRRWSFSASRPFCVVATEACLGVHFWGSEIGKLRGKVRADSARILGGVREAPDNDAADAEGDL